jgi:hypothetical protein
MESNISIMNESNRDHEQVLTDGTTLRQCEPVMSEHNQQFKTSCSTDLSAAATIYGVQH